tara:strand:+ start:54 stop:428 length:375 start_codon:yes stop_codon:yes gene_type:complete
LSKTEEVSIWVIKNTSTGEYLDGNENFVEDFSKASKWKLESTAIEKLHRFGQQGYEWYPEWAETADDEEKKDQYRSYAKDYKELFDNCVIINYSGTYTLVGETKMTAISKTKTEWDFEVITDTD